MSTKKPNVSLLISSLKELYENKSIDISKVKALLNERKITLEEYNHILGKEG